MQIIVRCCGERTEKKAIALAKKQGDVHIIRARPFGETLRQAYKLAITFKNQKWVPMIDADVLLIDNSLMQGLKYLNKLPYENIFCLDGKTKDKIMKTKRRAGIHIYRRILLKNALKYIDNYHIKPESHVRRSMTRQGYRTVTGHITFGYHDYEQYYCDLWRKAFCQSQKLARLIRKTQKHKKWRQWAINDKDYYVIYHAHKAAQKYQDKIIIDKNIDYEAKENLDRLGIIEKGELEK